LVLDAQPGAGATVGRMKRFLFLLGLWVLLAPSATSEEPAAPTTAAEALAVLVAAESYDEAAVGYAARKSLTYRAYEFLRKQSKIETWVERTSHKNPIVRCYAVRALAEAKAHAQLRAAVFKGLSDTARVNHLQGCCMGQAYVANVIAEIGLQNLDDKNVKALTDAILASSLPLLTRERMLWTGTFAEAHLPRVLTLARAGNLHALRGLAKHKRPEAATLIVDILEHPTKGTAKGDDEAVELRIHAAVIGVMGWAAPRFWKGLAGLRGRAATQLNHNWVRDYMHAVAGYENGAAAATLTQLLDVGRGADWKQRLTEQRVLDAIREHKVKSFAALRRRVSGS
jgi:hypothetical protein